MSDYVLGALVDLYAAFGDPNQPPNEVTLEILKPSGARVELRYSSSTIARLADGSFLAQVTADEPGTWCFYFVSTGANQGAGEGRFRVQQPCTRM